MLRLISEDKYEISMKGVTGYTTGKRLGIPGRRPHYGSGDCLLIGAGSL